MVQNDSPARGGGGGAGSDEPLEPPLDLPLPGMSPSSPFKIAHIIQICHASVGILMECR